MKKIISTLLLAAFFVLSTTTVTFARYGYHGYKNHHYRGRIHSYNYSRHHNRNYYSNDLWASWGVGLLTGIVINSIFYQPPRQQTIVYTSQPRMIVQSQPVIVRQQIRAVTSSPELILRQVIVTAEILNVRRIPGSDSSIINQLHQGETVSVIGAAPEWLYIKTAAGQHGWISTKYTSNTNQPVG